MAKNGEGGYNPLTNGTIPQVRDVRDISPGFEHEHQDALFDEHLNFFLKYGNFPDTLPAEISRESKDTIQRITRLKKLEENSELRQFCTELRNAILEHFDGKTQQQLLESMKFMLRVHIDDNDRTDTTLPGVSHQIKVALRVLGVLLKHNLSYKHNATILAAAMFHDIVEDHPHLLLLEKKKIARLRERLHADGKKFIPDDASAAEQVITLLEDEGGREDEKTKERRPNKLLGGLLRAVTLDRAELLQSWHSLSKPEALLEEKRLKEKGGTPEEKGERKRKKDELYWPYVFETMTEGTFVADIASLIKLCDLEDNALEIGKIRARYYSLLENTTAVDAKQIEDIRIRYNNLQSKYGPTLRDVANLLTTWPRDTLVGNIADEMREKIVKVLAEDYTTPLL